VVQGTSGRNALFGPGLFGLNASLFKTFKVVERVNLQVRAEAFQITNTPQFANPTCGTGIPCNASITSGTFGYVTSTVGSGSGVNGTGGGRAFQLGVKLFF